LTNTHFILPDAQITPGDDTEFVEWAGRYIVDHGAKHGDWNTTIIQLGDWWDMQSLSWYDRGKKVMEGTRVSKDTQAGVDAFERLDEPLQVYNSRRKKKWKPRRVALRGNHEERADRHAEANPQIDTVGVKYLRLPDGWEEVPFLDVEWIDGVAYSHYFYNPNTGRPYSGANVETRLKTIGHSFTMGHQQGLLVGMRPTLSGLHRGLVAGSMYPRNPLYLGPQTHEHWRGILVCHAVKNGNYNLMEVDLEFLAQRYGGFKDLQHYRRERGIV